MSYRIEAPKTLDTTIILPASKSISNRALIISALAKSSLLPENLSDCDDTEVMVKALKSTFDTTVRQELPASEPVFTPASQAKEEPTVIDIGAAGTAMRFLTAYFAVSPGSYLLTGSKRMKQRPIGILVDALRYLGADIEYEEREGYPPLRIRGRRLSGGHIDVDAGISSQFISALLMIGPVLDKGLELHMTGEIASRPYIDLTLNVMHSYGAQADWTEVDTVSVKPKPYTPCHYFIESDWTSASYWYEALALCDDYEATLTLKGLKDGSRQGDSMARYIFSMMGVKTAFTDATTVKLTRHLRTLPRLDYDFKNSPDLTQTLVAACGALQMPFNFKGLASLRIKETDRIKALCTEMRKIGVNLVAKDNELSYSTQPQEWQETTPVFDTYDDHRMALSLAPLAMKYGSVIINNPEVVTKSYPDFWNDLGKAGFNIEET
ncbi:MAG: 3-phosphoshikimate 1-carboxyvinyltransferase [Prevotella sp.]|nr:3-phosphoshikimate 1-carboxyvinyltransferase [Prevotella sp.]